MAMKDLLIGLALLSCPAIVFATFGTSGFDAFDEGISASPTFAAAEAGRIVFTEQCAVCHGRVAEGTGRGPGLIQPGYGPDRVSDDAFRRAMRAGVEPRRRGAAGMPAIPALTDRDADQVVTFLRALQRENGID